MPVPSLRHLDAGAGGHQGDLLCCDYTPDGAFILSGGWDGDLRLWEAQSSSEVTAFHANDKPISACAVSPDGKHWHSGGLDGLLATWDPVSQSRQTVFLAHARPISAIVYSPDGAAMATSSWDCNVTLWNRGRDREGRNLTGHTDIVAGCAFSNSGKLLCSWSYDGTLRLWDVNRSQLLTTLTGHKNRVTAGALSADGRWAASGAIDGTLKLWNLQVGLEAASITVGAEIKACPLLLDGQSLIAVSTNGRVTLHSLPDLEVRDELITSATIQCAAIAPSSGQLAFGTSQGKLQVVAIDGMEDASLLVNVSKGSRSTQTRFQRLVGKNTVTTIFRVHCPICRGAFEIDSATVSQVLLCAHCRRRLCVNEIR